MTSPNGPARAGVAVAGIATLSLLVATGLPVPDAQAAGTPARHAAAALPAAVKKPTASFTFSTSSPNAGATVVVSYSVGNAKGYKVTLQRAFGTASVYKDVAKLGATGGKVSIKAPGLGQYKYRIALKKGKKVYASATKTLRSYGRVDLAKLIDSTTNNTLTVGGRAFTYVYSNTIWGTADTVLKTTSSKCKFVHFDGATFASAGQTMAINFEDRDPVSTSIVSNTIASVSSSVTVGRAWTLTAGQRQLVGSTLYLNGYGVCYSAAAGQIND